MLSSNELVQWSLRHLPTGMPEYHLGTRLAWTAGFELLLWRRRPVCRQPVPACLGLQVLVTRYEHHARLRMAPSELEDVREDAIVVIADVQAVLGIGLDINPLFAVAQPPGNRHAADRVAAPRELLELADDEFGLLLAH